GGRGGRARLPRRAAPGRWPPRAGWSTAILVLMRSCAPPFSLRHLKLTSVNGTLFQGCHEPATFLRYEGTVTGTLADSGALEDVLLPPRFSYASDELGLSAQGVVRLIEWATGQPRIRRMYQRYTKLGRPPELFWQDAIAELRLDLKLNPPPAHGLPAPGP